MDDLSLRVGKDRIRSGVGLRVAPRRAYVSVNYSREANIVGVGPLQPMKERLQLDTARTTFLDEDQQQWPAVVRTRPSKELVPVGCCRESRNSGCRQRGAVGQLTWGDVMHLRLTGLGRHGWLGPGRLG